MNKKIAIIFLVCLVPLAFSVAPAIALTPYSDEIAAASNWLVATQFDEDYIDPQDNPDPIAPENPSPPEVPAPPEPYVPPEVPGFELPMDEEPPIRDTEPASPI